MTTRANQPEDFPPERFDLIAFCEACGHSGLIARDRIPAGLSVPALPARLRCGVCGARQAGIRFVYTGAGGFHYSATGLSEAR
jgi:hypothetical protein